MLINKIFGALLAVALVILALPTLTNMAFGKGGHHGAFHDERSINERAAEKLSYWLPVSESGGEVVEEEVFDLGAALAVADADAGATSFRSLCSSCHTIEAGGADGTGPNLHNVVGRAMAGKDGFGGYSSAMSGMGSEWSYEALNEFILSPRGYVNGTAMSFAGIRREDQRMNVIAFLAANTDNAPAFPDPLPEKEDVVEGAEAAVVEGAEAVEGGLGGMVEEASAEAEEAAGDLMDAAEGVVAEAVETVEEAVEDAEDAAEDAVDDVVTGRRGPTNH